jgi:cytidylate kinase
VIIAIDGPAAAGKGTLARRLAAHLGYAMLDTGLLYRGVAWHVLEAAGNPENPADAAAAAATLGVSDLSNSALRGEDCAAAASKVAAIAEVRAVLLEMQRDFARNPPGGAKGAVLDGRDIGTTVCPAAEAKLFITASVEERARRRLKELRERDLDAIHARVLQDMKERDERDTNRGVAPLVSAHDALVIDTGPLSVDQVFETALAYINSRNRSG